VLEIEISAEKFNQIRMGSTRAVAVLGFAYDDSRGVVHGPIRLVTEGGMSMGVDVSAAKYLRICSLIGSDANDVGYATLGGMLESWATLVGTLNENTGITILQFRRTDVEGG
jgi:hypothetical protein